MDKNDALVAELLDINQDLYNKEYITPTGGNISARSADDPEKIVITPSQVYKRRLCPEQMLWLDMNGNNIGACKIKASTETPIHLAVYRSRPDIQAVVHTHPVYTNIFGLTDIRWLPIDAEAVMLQGIPIIEWTSGTEESGRLVAQAIGQKGAFVLIRNHGLVVGGPSLSWAAGVTDMIEVVCKMLVTCKMMGVQPQVLAKPFIEAIQAKASKGEGAG
jgi:L-fuculose-phosphate aldolase